MTFSYDPTQIQARGKDQMRFELGDTMTAGGAETSALSDEEYIAILSDIGPGKRAWLSAKLHIVEAILLKLSYQVNTKVDVITYGFGDRAKHWYDLYEMLRKEILGNSCIPSIAESAARKPPYFHTDMKVNRRAQPIRGHGESHSLTPFRNLNS